jgi:hypothetical protein
VANKLSDGTIRDEENDDLRAGCKLGRGDAAQIYVRLLHGLCGVKLIGVAVGCDGFSTKFCTIRISLSFCYFELLNCQLLYDISVVEAGNLLFDLCDSRH